MLTGVQRETFGIIGCGGIGDGIRASKAMAGGPSRSLQRVGVDCRKQRRRDAEAEQVYTLT